MKKLLLLFLFSFVFFGLRAQTAQPLDTVYLMSGKVVTGIVKDSADEQLKILIPKKKSPGEFKADFVDMDLVYSVKYRTGTTSVFYKQDTLFGNYFTPREVEYFIYGERDAMRSYRCGWVNAGGFVFGLAGGVIAAPLSILAPPFAYGLGTTLFRVKIKPGAVSNPNYLKYDTYIMGYEKDARKRRVFRSMTWTAIGSGVGLLSRLIYDNNKVMFNQYFSN